MTVAQLKHTMSAQEFLDWLAYDRHRHDQAAGAVTVTKENADRLFGAIATAQQVPR